MEEEKAISASRIGPKHSAAHIGDQLDSCQNKKTCISQSLIWLICLHFTDTKQKKINKKSASLQTNHLFRNVFLKNLDIKLPKHSQC